MTTQTPATAELDFGPFFFKFFTSDPAPKKQRRIPPESSPGPRQLATRDEHRSRLDRTGSGLKPILAGSGLDRTAIFLKIGGSGLD